MQSWMKYTPAGEIMWLQTVEVTILAGTEDVEAQQTMTGGVVQESAWDIAPSMTQVKATNSIGNRGSRVGEETIGVKILTGTEAIKTRQHGILFNHRHKLQPQKSLAMRDQAIV